MKEAVKTTDWDALYEPLGEAIDGIMDWVSEYIRFCMDKTIPTKVVRCYANHKPWLTSDQKIRRGLSGRWTEQNSNR